MNLTLETGTTDRTATTTVAQSGDNTIELTYTVQEGDETALLDYVGTGSLSFGVGASILDQNNNPVTDLTLPALAGGALNSCY